MSSIVMNCAGGGASTSDSMRVIDPSSTPLDMVAAITEASSVAEVQSVLNLRGGYSILDWWPRLDMAAQFQVLDAMISSERYAEVSALADLLTERVVANPDQDLGFDRQDVNRVIRSSPLQTDAVKFRSIRDEKNITRDRARAEDALRQLRDQLPVMQAPMPTEQEQAHLAQMLSNGGIYIVPTEPSPQPSPVPAVGGFGGMFDDE